MNVTDTLGPSGLMARYIAGYEVRPQQLEMAQLIEDCIAAGDSAIIEGPTGIGKSYAYLIPAIASGNKAVISTANKTLQNQLVKKDLPRLRELLGNVSFAVAKGRGNYFCPKVFWGRGGGAERMNMANPTLYDWCDSACRTGGDIDDAPIIPTSEEREWMAAPDACKPRECRYWLDGNCPYYNAKEVRDNAQIIVTNHALLLVALNSPGVLPKAETLIVDEAHQLEGYAVNAASCELTTFRSRRLLPVDAHEEFDEWLNHLGARFLTGNDAEAAIPGTYEDVRGLRIAGTVNQIAGEAELEEQGKLTRLGHDLIVLASHTERGAVRTVERREGRQSSYLVGKVTTFDVTEMLASIKDAYDTVVMTSATLSTGRHGFDFFKKRNGVTYPVRDLALQTPFSFQSQAMMYLPHTLPSPSGRDYDAWLAAARAECLGLVKASAGGALLLFTSFAAMRSVTEHLRANGLPVKAQGEENQGALIQWLKATEGAILCASASFWEGVDIPGDALRLVVIDRIPFAAQTPVETARQAWVGPKAFIELSVPEATLHLRQAFGRLIRTTTDRGVVAILDTRLSSTGYGKVIKSALPPAPVARYMADVCKFYQGRNPQTLGVPLFDALLEV